MPSPVFTVGYEGRTLPEFVALVKENRIDVVVDVRALPLSRRRGFSKTPLRTALERAGVEYLHLRVAGNPFRSKKGDIDECLRLYQRHLASSPEVLDALLEATEGHRAALLCVEADAACCHRSVIVEGMKKRDPRRAYRDL